MSEKTRAMHARIDDAQVARSICPYCGVGCGQLIYHKNGKLISIEGDPESPISQGNLCPKGAASYQLLTHDRRETKVKYRAPRAKEWTSLSLVRVNRPYLRLLAPPCGAGLLGSSGRFCNAARRSAK
jgi:formate dehydrogenase major subunit